MKQALLDFPGECSRIAVEFEETGAYLYRRRKAQEHNAPSDGDYAVEETFGDEDEEPYYGDD